TMIAATLDFSRDAALEKENKFLDLGVLLKTLCDDASDNGGRAEYEGPDKFAFSGRPVALKRVFGNLIENAIAYGNRAMVSLIDERNKVTVTIDDDGPGIAAEDRENVFRPFVRLEGSRSRETGGVGLGLSVVRSVVHAHGGEVTLENRPEGGLRVGVTLPLP
ncbi:MAG TPA: GHKL domain-containing protein, partial [Alphaproteobacteria bacterium]|nr:GHKL domain-containing protein [Alphaproteobacteria bacterium]